MVEEYTKTNNFFVADPDIFPPGITINSIWDAKDRIVLLEKRVKENYQKKVTNFFDVDKWSIIFKK